MKCRSCKGSGECSACEGTRSGKKVNTHPDPNTVDDKGDSPCPGCGGTGICSFCNGDG